MLRLISSLFSQPKSTRYKFAGQLCRLKDYVYTLTMTRDGVLLTSGGNCPIGSLVKSNKCSIGPDGVRVWNVKTHGHMQVPHHSLAQRGAVCCVLWAKIPNEAHEMLFFGTGLGYLVMWTMSVSESVPIQGIILTVLNFIQGDPEEFSEVSVQRAAHGREVTSLASSKAAGDSVYIAVGMEDRAVLLYKLQSDKLLAVFSVELDCSIPAAVAFTENGEDVLVFGMKDGNV